MWLLGRQANFQFSAQIDDKFTIEVFNVADNVVIRATLFDDIGRVLMATFK